MRKAFFAFYALIVLVGIGSLIGFWYESKGRAYELQNTWHFYNQMQLYEKSLLSLSKTCLQKYGIEQCSFLQFSLGIYQAKIELKEIEEKVVQVDILLEFLHPLSGMLLRSNYRGFLENL